MAGQQYIGTAYWGVTQAIAYSGTPGTVPNAVTQGVTKVRILVTTDAYVTYDGSVPSSTNGTYMPALTPEPVTIRPGQKVSAVQVSAAGILQVTEYD